MKPIKRKYYFMAAALCLLGIAALFYSFFFTRFSTATETSYIYIDADDTVDSVYAKLTPLASSRAMTGFRTLSRHKGYDKAVRTGRYAIDPQASIVSVFRQLRNGQQEPIRLTVPQVRTMPQLAQRLSQRLMVDSAAIAQALCDEHFCQQLGYDTATIACMFVPNTYEVFWNVSVDGLMKRMQKEHDAFWTADRQRKAGALGLSPNEVCTLASIVDEETANNPEKPTIAGMYLNRLAKGMPLQADPTVKFALGDFSLRRILNKHLEADSPYNTYKHAGLPPGPIKIASVQGIDAVLNAVPSDYLYMCAKEDFSGTHNFARTLQEHLQNARRYQQALNQRGIR